VRIKNSDIQRKLSITFIDGVRTTDWTVLGKHPSSAEENYQEHYPGAHVE
jgi:hypothetical protein